MRPEYSKVLHKLLIKAFHENPIYVPWDTRRRDPTWYKNSLRAQFKYLCNTYTVALYGVNCAEMWHLENKIIETNLCICTPTSSQDRYYLNMEFIDP